MCRIRRISMCLCGMCDGSQNNALDNVFDQVIETVQGYYTKYLRQMKSNSIQLRYALIWCDTTLMNVLDYSSDYIYIAIAFSNLLNVCRQYGNKIHSPQSFHCFHSHKFCNQISKQIEHSFDSFCVNIFHFWILTSIGNWAWKSEFIRDFAIVYGWIISNRMSSVIINFRTFIVRPVFFLIFIL